MAVKIRPIVLKDAASYRRCYHAVAKERRYFCEYEAPPVSDVRKDVRKCLRQKNPFVVAVEDDRVIGFAVVYRYEAPSLSRNGRFGIGLLPAYRGMGLGAKLMTRLLNIARGKFDSVYLDVFGENIRARKLYKKMGFKPAGRIKNSVKGLAYGTDDIVLMQNQLRR